MTLGTKGALALGAGVITVLALTSSPRPAYLPDPSLTPGDIRAGCTAETLRDPKFRTGDVRDVPESVKRAVCKAYGVAYPFDGEIDHLISLELCGSNDQKNLWPEPKSVVIGGVEYGFRVKDVTENAAAKAVKAGTLSLFDAQSMIRTDWTKLHDKLGLK